MKITIILWFLLSFTYIARSQTKLDTLSVLKESLFWTKYGDYIFPRSITKEEMFKSKMQSYMNTYFEDTVYIDRKSVKGELGRYKLDYINDFSRKPIFNNSGLHFVFIDVKKHAKKLQHYISKNGIKDTGFIYYELIMFEIKEDTAKVVYERIDYLIYPERILFFYDDVFYGAILKKEECTWRFYSW